MEVLDIFLVLSILEPDILHTNEELEPVEAYETRTASPSDSTSPLSPNHPLIQTSPTPTPSRASYYCSTAHMIVHTQPTMSFDYSAKLTKAMTLSPSSFRKRYIPSCDTPTSSSSPPVVSSTLPPQNLYQGTSEPIADIDTESEESEDESIDSKIEEAVSEDQQQAVLVEGTTIDEPLGLEDITHSTFQVGQRSRSVSDQQVADETPTPRLLVRPTWADPEDASLTVPSPVPLLVTTPTANIDVDEEEFLEGFGRDITELLARSRAVRDENVATQRELQELKDCVTTLDQERSRKEE
uniref:Uncharacterized protein n=1 Tax=Tanacetum cinerariifolium TaxID=118510 RepID=A0A6L2MKH7_TANCI|nr:hypothetical protein [Tanacetum cinerariifolium]